MADLYTSIRRFVMPLSFSSLLKLFQFCMRQRYKWKYVLCTNSKKLLITVSDSFPVSRVPALNRWSQKLRSIYASIFVTTCPFEKKELRNAFIKFLLWVRNVIVLENHSVSTMLPQTRLARLSRYRFSAIGTGLLRKHVPVCTSCVLVLKLFQVFLWNYRYFPISRLHRLAFREEINVTVSFRLAEQSKSAEGERYCLLWPNWGTRK